MNSFDWLRSPILKNGPLHNAEPSIREICRSGLGIHAARPQTPFLSLFVRNRSLTYAELQHELNEQRSAIRIRCMRTTLHVTTIDLAPVLHFSTLKQRLQKCRQMEKGVSDYAINEAATEAWIRDRVEKVGHITERIDEIEGCEVTGASLAAFRLKLKYLWETGALCFEDLSDQWHKERRIFRLTRNSYGDIFERDPNKSDDDYCIELGRLYFHAFGPASLKDFAWWSGLGITAAGHIIRNLQAHGLISRTIDDIDLYYFDAPSGQYELTSDQPCLLPWEDHSLKAYFETRFRYGTPEVLKRAFNSIGEARRTIVLGGRIVGIWDVDSNGMPRTYELFDQPLEVKRGVERELARLGSDLDNQKKQLNLFRSG